jgi:hypothetical protein
VHTGFWWGCRRERARLEDLGIDGRIMLEWLCKIQDRSVEWIDLAQVREKWRALLIAVMNFRLP